MFSKAIALLLLTASAIAGPLAEGTYKITNVDFGSTARVDGAGDQIYVSRDDVLRVDSDLWTLKDAEDDGYTIDNVYINMIKMLDSYAAVRELYNGAPVVTDRNATVFNIESAGGSTYVIKLQNVDYLWNVEPPVVPDGNVALRRASGKDAQKWNFTAVEFPPA